MTTTKETVEKWSNKENQRKKLIRKKGALGGIQKFKISNLNLRENSSAET